MGSNPPSRGRFGPVSLSQVIDIAFVRFQAPDLMEMRGFLEDFGLRCYMINNRLYGSTSDGSPFAHSTRSGPPGFLGLGFRVGSMDELQRLAVADSVPVEELNTPGGGYRVRLTDPDGFEIDVVANVKWASPDELDADVPLNTAAQRRRFQAPVRVRQGPSHVRRLGHAVLSVSDFARSERWYKEHFGFITSDQIEAEPGVAIGAFLRCDRGDTPTDHHTLFLVQGPESPGFNHAAFEVGGLDDLMVGHAHLKAQNRDPAWGVGRHVLGSQIFDYWKDPWGHELEHWTDGDLLTAKDVPGVAGLDQLLGTQWGSPHPMTAAQK